ncbi:hypothetical protein AcW1_008695 [Taiwanofungus camphoratus]|nr:hypothetical protein AcW1_008695 [Antrodia cinnamomea]
MTPSRLSWHLTPRPHIARLHTELRSPLRICRSHQHRPSQRPGKGSHQKRRSSGEWRTSKRGSSICRHKDGERN